jgi:DNA-binding transcriptional LysR family regulator
MEPIFCKRISYFGINNRDLKTFVAADDSLDPQQHIKAQEKSFHRAWRWDGGPAILQSRAWDEAGNSQPSREQFVALRGETTKPPSVHNLVATTRFITVLSKSMFGIMARSLSIKALPVHLPATQRKMAIVALRKRTLSPIAQLFIETVCAVVKPQPKAKKSAD